MKLIHFLVAPLVSAGVIRTTEQFPILGDVAKEFVQLTAGEESSPVVGVHFTTSYAVAAARYQDGTTRELVRVAADAEYIEVLSRWTQWKNEFKIQDCSIRTRYLTLPEELMRGYHCSMRFLQRTSRQALGLPASRDAATLSTFMQDVRRSIEAELGAPISTIAPAFPQLSPHGQEDVQEALSFAGLASTRVRTGHGNMIMYDEANAAYAGLGHGLCEEWSFKSDCLAADWPAKQQSVPYFSFDNSSFSVGAMTLQNAFQEHSTYLHGLDMNLGWWNLPVYGTPRAKFWARMHEMILDVLAPMPMPPNRIIILGDHGADEEFQEAVEAAMWDKFDEFDVAQMLQTVKNENIGRLAARGAAELGWRDEEFKRKYVSGMRGAGETVEL